MPSDNKTEKATPKRRGEARKKGQVARSVEVNTAVALLMAWLLLKVFGEGLVTGLGDMAAFSFSHISRPDLTQADLRDVVISHFLGIGKIELPIAGGLLLAGLLANVAQVGFQINPEAAKPQFSRINPLTGFQRLFSANSLVELFRGSFKLVVVGFLAYKAMSDHLMELLHLTGSDLRSGITLISSIAFDLLLKVALAFLVLAIADYGFQRWQFERKLKMTKHEVREEARAQELNEQVRSRIRSMQRQLARKRMMQRVPQADVVITNPTHLAIALQYDASRMVAPKVVAKGQRLIAEQIKELARQHGIPLVENKPLAQALFKAVEVDQEIPPELYKATAEVLAFIYRLKRRAS